MEDEAIRRGLKKAEGQFWKLALTPPGQSNRTDKSRLLAVLGISEIDYIARYTSPVHTDWVMRCTARKGAADGGAGAGRAAAAEGKRAA